MDAQPILDLPVDYSSLSNNSFIHLQDWTNLYCSHHKINFIHLNIRSLNKHWDQFLVYIDSFIKYLDVIILSEINIKSIL